MGEKHSPMSLLKKTDLVYKNIGYTHTKTHHLDEPYISERMISLQRWLTTHNNDLLDSFIFLILSVFIFVLSIKMDGFGETILSPGTFPAFGAVVLFLLALGLFYTGIKARKNSEETETDVSKSHWIPVLIVTLLCLVYIWVLPLFHFVISTIAFLALFLFYIGERRIWMVTIVSLSTTLIIYFVFGKILKVFLP